MQAKRIQVVALSGAAGAQFTVSLTTPTSPREEINYHNIWGSFCIEPLDAAANAQGSWILYTLKANEAGPVFTDAIINAESNNASIIACGVWCAANEMPHNQMVNVKTSRNLMPGEKMQLAVHVAGVTAGLVLARVMLCAHTTRK